MTAMPPTTGHLQLVKFASRLADSVVVLLNTQPHEPMPTWRAQALLDATEHMPLVEVRWTHKTLEQNPQTPGFWDMWAGILKSNGVTAADYIVSSETYGQKLAEITGAQFFPYDIDRSLNSAKATYVRLEPWAYFAEILPEFRRYLRTTVTVFGAESTGKTTLAKRLGALPGITWAFEYARPYLENTSTEINVRSMEGIWKGQFALQQQVAEMSEDPCIVQDTDLFSTIGYWELPHWQTVLGEPPLALLENAWKMRSDLYIVTKSNIPFEQDPIRYGGDKREGSDSYWLDICEKYDLPHVVLYAAKFEDRLAEAQEAIRRVSDLRLSAISFDRHGL
jgi:HTH-type transcriptional repressor of NAD biosynthesis genes